MSGRRLPSDARPAGGRRLAFGVLCAVCVLVAGGYAGMAAWRARAATGAPGVAVAASGALAEAAARPHLVFLSTAVGESYGKVALVPLDAPDGPRYATALQCDRVYGGTSAGLCLGNNVLGGFLSSYSAYTFDAAFEPRHTFNRNGIPTRVRISPDGRYGVTTVFVTGDSYAAGGFSTRTTLIDIASGALVGDLEEFAVWRDGERVQAPDFNFWGVTFARDSNRFYTTLGTGGKAYLMEGDVAGRQGRLLRENVECPSLSPDGTRLVFKKHVSNDARSRWQLHLLDLATMTETPLANEPRSIDDQVEWLDDAHILYGWADEGPPRTTATSVWVLPVDGTEPARVFLSQAYSPAVVR